MSENISTLKQQIIEHGWKIIPPSRFDKTGVDWAAVKQTKGLPDCHCNNRSPQFIMTPWSFDMHGKTFESIDVGITAETKDGVWLKLSAYTLKPNLSDIEAALPKLVAAWIAAAETEVAL